MAGHTFNPGDRVEYTGLGTVVNEHRIGKTGKVTAAEPNGHGVSVTWDDGESLPLVVQEKNLRMTAPKDSGKLLTASERAAFLSALDEPMTDEEAVGLIAELVTLTAAISKIATQEQQKALLPTIIRAGNMAPYVANRLAAVAALVEAAEDMLAGAYRGPDQDRLRAALQAMGETQ